MILQFMCRNDLEKRLCRQEPGRSEQRSSTWALPRPRVTAAPENMRGTHDISQNITTAAVTLGKVETAFSPAVQTLVLPLYLETAQGLVPERRWIVVAPIQQFHDSDEEQLISLR
jgi:hypothetical protein